MHKFQNPAVNDVVFTVPHNIIIACEHFRVVRIFGIHTAAGVFMDNGFAQKLL